MALVRVLDVAVRISSIPVDHKILKLLSATCSTDIILQGSSVRFEYNW